MGDEELSPADKLKIAANFIAHAPPGQSQRVKETVDTLLDGVPIPPELMRKLHTTQYLGVKMDDDGRVVLLTPFGELPDGSFVDPVGNRSLIIDHFAEKCTGFGALPPAMMRVLLLCLVLALPCVIAHPAKTDTWSEEGDDLKTTTAAQVQSTYRDMSDFGSPEKNLAAMAIKATAKGNGNVHSHLIETALKEISTSEATGKCKQYLMNDALDTEAKECGTGILCVTTENRHTGVHYSMCDKTNMCTGKFGGKESKYKNPQTIVPGKCGTFPMLDLKIYCSTDTPANGKIPSDTDCPEIEINASPRTAAMSFVCVFVALFAMFRQ